jgi:sugar lactone lactonase YvrE
MSSRQAVLFTAVVLSLWSCNGGTSGTVPSTSTTQYRQTAEQGTSLTQGRRHTSTGYIYTDVEIASGGAVNWYPFGSNGDVPPAGTITGPATGLGYNLGGIAIDAAGEIYVANQDSDTIVGFAPGSSGNATPNIVIGGKHTHLHEPNGMAVDSSGNLYVASKGIEANAPGIEVFASGSNGDAKPIKHIDGPLTQLNQPNAVAVDSAGTIYVANRQTSTILIFDAKQRGDHAPRRVIAGNKTGINSPNGIAVDANGIYAGSGVSPFFERFNLSQKGNKPPAALVEGSYTQLQCCTNGLTAAPDGTVYIVSDGTPNSIQQFDGLADGNVAPLTTISGPDTQLDSVRFLTVTQ